MNKMSLEEVRCVYETKWLRLMHKRLGVSPTKFRTRYYFSVDALLAVGYGPGRTPKMTEIKSKVFADTLERNHNPSSIGWTDFGNKYYRQMLSYQRMLILEALRGREILFEMEEI
jgi:hypothetical protein